MSTEKIQKEAAEVGKSMTPAWRKGYENAALKYAAEKERSMGEIKRLRDYLKSFSDRCAEQEKMWASIDDGDNAMFWAAMKTEVDTNIYPKS